MAEFNNPPTLWDLSQAHSFSQIPDDDFLALLQKQFPATVQGMPNLVSPPNNEQPSLSVNPQNLDETGGSQKRKALDDDDVDEGPSKNTKKTLPASLSKRKSTGSPNTDDSRLLKRKEQNRAAQRAFRERKEKHVKELEDKVAALEAKNDESTNENQNLRDLLSRLQNENMMLKQQQFTFQMSKNAPSSIQSPPGMSEPSTSTSSSVFTPFPHSTPTFSFSTSPSFPTTSPPVASDAMDALEYTSYANLDPNAFNLFDDLPKSVDMDFAFDNPPQNGEFINITSNPVFASMPAIFDVSPSPSQGGPTPSPVAHPATVPATRQQDTNILSDFDLNSLSAWPLPTSPPTGLHGSLDDLFGYSPGTANTDFGMYNAVGGSGLQPNVSPVVHHAPGPAQQAGSNASSPSSHASDPSLFSTAPSQDHDSPTSDMSDGHARSHIQHDSCGTGSGCPKTRSDFEKVVSRDGPSVFSPSASGVMAAQNAQIRSQEEALSTMRKLTSGDIGPMVICQGTSLPKTEKNDRNIEVLAAWRTIRNDPRYKDLDINTLCSEFSSKAKCDGTKAHFGHSDPSLGEAAKQFACLEHWKKETGLGEALLAQNHSKELGRINGGLGPVPHLQQQTSLPNDKSLDNSPSHA